MIIIGCVVEFEAQVVPAVTGEVVLDVLLWTAVSFVWCVVTAARDGSTRDLETRGVVDIAELVADLDGVHVGDELSGRGPGIRRVRESRSDGEDWAEDRWLGP